MFPKRLHFSVLIWETLRMEFPCQTLKLLRSSFMEIFRVCAYRFWLSWDNRFSVSRNCMSEFLSDVWVTKSSSFVSFNSFLVVAKAAWASSSWILQDKNKRLVENSFLIQQLYARKQIDFEKHIMHFILELRVNMQIPNYKLPTFTSPIRYVFEKHSKLRSKLTPKIEFCRL